MKQMLKRTIVGSAIALLLIPTVASAHEGHEHDTDKTTSDRDSSSKIATSSQAPDAKRVQELRTKIDARLQEMKQERSSAVEDKKAEVRQRLSDAKKKVCEKHQTRINNLMTGMNTRRQNAFDRISQVSEAVQSYYANNELSVANYDELLATVTAAKAAAEAGLTAQQSAPKLDCAGEQPKADLSDFKTKRADSIDAMKEYRTAVKALVQAVRAAANEGDA